MVYFAVTEKRGTPRRRNRALGLKWPSENGRRGPH